MFLSWRMVCCLGAGPDNPHCTLSCLLLSSFSINIKYAALLQLVLDRALLSGEHIFQVFKPPRQRWFSFTWGSATITLLENHFWGCHECPWEGLIFVNNFATFKYSMLDIRKNWRSYKNRQWSVQSTYRTPGETQKPPRLLIPPCYTPQIYAMTCISWPILHFHYSSSSGWVCMTTVYNPWVIKYSSGLMGNTFYEFTLALKHLTLFL